MHSFGGWGWCPLVNAGAYKPGIFGRILWFSMCLAYPDCLFDRDCEGALQDEKGVGISLPGFYVFSAWKDFMVKILLGSSLSKTVIPLVLNCSTSFLVLAGRVAYLWGVSHCNHQL